MIEINGFEKQRKKAGLTQQEVADALKVAQCTVSLWESGVTYPTGNRIQAIAKLYGCTIDELYAEKPA